MKWIRIDRTRRTVLRKQLEGFTLELTDRAGSNRQGPRLISARLAHRLIREMGFMRVE